MKKILSLFIAISFIATSNVYSQPQSKTTLRPPLATSKTARDQRKILDEGQNTGYRRGAASVAGTISAGDHRKLNVELHKRIDEQYQEGSEEISEVISASKGEELKGLPIHLYVAHSLLRDYGVAGHYGIRHLNIFLDSLLLQQLSLREKERYFDHEFYELVRIIHYAMTKFGDGKTATLARKMEVKKHEEITMEHALEWFKKFCDFKKANEKKVDSILNKLVAFLDEEKNRFEVEPLLSSIHRQAPELPDLVIARLAQHRLENTDTAYVNFEALSSLLKGMIELEARIGEEARKLNEPLSPEKRDSIKRYIELLNRNKEKLKRLLVGDIKVAVLFKKLAGAVVQEGGGALSARIEHDIFAPLVIKKVIKMLNHLRRYELDAPVRGAASVGEDLAGAEVELTSEAKNAKINKLRREAFYAEDKNLWVFAYRRLRELERLNPSETDILQRIQKAYQSAVSQVGPLGKIALDRELIVLYDGIDQDVVGHFPDMHGTDAMSKATSNGSLIERAIKLKHHDETIKRLAATGASIEDIFDEIVAKTLIRSGVKAMVEAHQAGEPAGVSIEIESHLDDAALMSSRANELARMVGGTDMRDVTINKIPATGKLGDDNTFKGPGIDTIEEAIYSGLYPNVTLVMCSRSQIKAIAGAIARGLGRRVARLREEGVPHDDIIKELQGFKSYISYFISRVSGELVKNKDIARKISQAETKEEKLALAYRFMDLACAFFVDANEIFVSELRKNGFDEFEKLGCPITIELDASTGEKELPTDSPVIKALTEGKGAITIGELSRHMLIKGFKQNYTNWGYYVLRLARPGTADTIPIDLYSLLKAGKGNDKINAMTLQEAAEALQYAEREFGLNEEKWENMAVGLITGGVNSFIKAEQTVRLEIAKILIDVAIGNEEYDYAVREIDKLHRQFVELNKQGAIDDSLQKEADALRARIDESKALKLASAEQQPDDTTVLTASTLEVAAAEAAGAGATAGGKSALMTRLDNLAVMRQL